MRAQSTGPLLSTVFVDYDNIYLSLKRKSEEAARRFAKDCGHWLKQIESGRLITPTTGGRFPGPRRIVMNRCYGNPVPRRNAHDNSTDMNSFPFVRHHFLRAGFEVIDCPPLTAQLKNSADIRMVMDVRDVLNHETYFDEFLILSGDADFTTVLHRLRAHARRTVVFANDHTAAPYTAISDGEIREGDLIALLLEGRMPGEAEPNAAAERALPSSAELEALRRDILAEIVGSVRATGQPVPLEALADRAVRALGYDKTVGSAWAGAGSFRDLLARGLPDGMRLSNEPPYYVFDSSRQVAAEPVPRLEARERTTEQRPECRPPPPPPPTPRAATAPPAEQGSDAPSTAFAPAPQTPLQPAAFDPAAPALPPHPAPPQAQLLRTSDGATAIQQSIARIHEACQAPPLSPPEYRVLFEMMAEEINTNSLAGAQTLANIVERARAMGVEVRRDDVRFVLEVVSETDPWFEQGASTNLFASRFRNFVVARCRGQGLNLSADELDLIEAWFGGSPAAQRGVTGAGLPRPPEQPQVSIPAARPQPHSAVANAGPAGSPRAERPWTSDESGQSPREDLAAGGFAAEPDDEFPRIVRTRRRG